MYHVPYDESIKIERYLLITRQGGIISIRPSKSIYLLLPAEIVQRLKGEFNLDIKKEKNLEKVCSLVREDENGREWIRIIYDVWRPSKQNRQEQQTGENKR